MGAILGVVVLVLLVAVIFAVWSLTARSRRPRATSRGTEGGMRTRDGSGPGTT